MIKSAFHFQVSVFSVYIYKTFSVDMNLPGDDLFLLIKSLNASEKRYFKLFADRQGSGKSKSYLKVFDLMDGQEDIYDENLLKRKLKVRSEIDALPRTKVYLHDMIMKSMRLYRSEKDVASEVFDLIQDELFYTEKGLIGMRAKTMKRAKELAYTHDLMYLLLAIIQRERVYALKYTGGDPIKKMEEIHSEEVNVLQHLNNEAELGRIAYTLWAQLIIDPLLNDKAILKEFTAYKDHDLLKDYSVLKTFMEKISFLRSQNLVSRFNKDVKGQFDYNKKIVELFDSYPQHKFNVNHNYIDALANYLAASHKAGIYDEFERVIDQLHNLPKDKIKDEVSIAVSAIHHKLLYIMNTGKFHLSESVIAEFEKVCTTHKKLITETFILINNYNIMIMLFIKKEYERALVHCLRVIETKSKARIELQHGAQIMQIVLHYELGNLVFLESLCRNTVRAMRKDKNFSEFDQLFFTYIKKIIKSPTRELKPVFTQMFNDFLLIKNKSPENIYVFMSETLAWCKSKMENKPLTETIFYKYD